MSGIICAIRGGPASRNTIARAISLAKETGEPLFFLYVVNLDFMASSSSSRVQTISEEMRQMGEFILLMAQSRAAEKGVEARPVIREGEVEEQIVKVAQEVGADYVVLGRPASAEAGNVFSLEKISGLADKIRKETGAEVVFAEVDG